MKRTGRPAQVELLLGPGKALASKLVSMTHYLPTLSSMTGLGVSSEYPSCTAVDQSWTTDRHVRGIIHPFRVTKRKSFRVAGASHSFNPKGPKCQVPTSRRQPLQSLQPVVEANANHICRHILIYRLGRRALRQHFPRCRFCADTDN